MTSAYRLIRPLLMTLPPETAHRMTLKALQTGLVRGSADEDPILAVHLWGQTFANPVGLAAGFDKNAQAPRPLLRMGFGFVEIGSVTPRPQAGNPRPRVFRLPRHGAIINRLGFNNDGLAAAAERLRQVRSAPDPARPIGANVGCNKDSPDSAADYRLGIATLAPLVDYVVVNVSSPNTPGLRLLQQRAALEELLGVAIDARSSSGATPPLLLKIAPDLGEEDLEDIVTVALNAGIDGLIVSNTTVARPPGLPPRLAQETGGLSGRPLMGPSTAMLRSVARLTGGRMPLIGVGGVASGRDAYAKIRAGASLVQLYTALVYGGPPLIGAIKRELANLVRADGFASVMDAVGADV